VRPVLIAAALVVGALAAPTTSFGETPTTVPGEIVDCGDKVDAAGCLQSRDDVIPGTPSTPTGHRGGGDPNFVTMPVVVRAGEPAMCSATSGEPRCLDVSGLDLPAGSPDCIKAQVIGHAPDLVDVARQMWQDAFARYDLCPSTGTGADGADPVVVAIRAWQHIPLPAPGPYIAPGWMITGKDAYLETRGELAHTSTVDTPLGPLTLRASGRYSVDWGDGTKDGPFTIEGRPWPEGQIRHVYINVGTYDVVLIEDWTATWQLGPYSGNIGGMRTKDRIPGFEVKQIQAVVTPG